MKKRLAVAVAIVVVSVVYVVHYGQCDFHSKFCIMDIATTRSEVGFEWDSNTFYVSSWPVE